MAITNSDGSIILTTKIDDSGIKEGTKNLRSEAAKLAAEYRKAGMSQSEAFKKAWSEVERTNKQTKETTKSTKKYSEQVQKTGNTAKKAFSSVGSTLKGLMITAASVFSIYELINFGKQAVNLASDLQEVQNVVDVAFGEMRGSMEAFADTAIETYGISKLTAKQTGSSYMAMAKGMGMADEAAADMALTLTGLSADMASFYNIRQEEAKTALSAVFTGETKTLKRYGILITEVNLQEYARQKGITKSISAMSQQEKVMLRYQYILNATSLAQGDFVRTQDSWANQTRILSERWKEMSTTFGEAFIAIGTLVLPAINLLISGLSRVAEYTKVAASAIYTLFTGKTLNLEQTSAGIESVGTSSNDAAQGMENLGDATEEAGKQAKKALAPFDDLQILADNISDSTASAGTAFDIPSVNGGGNVLGNYDIKSGVDEETTTWITNAISAIAGKIQELTGAFSGLSGIDTSGLTNSLKGLAEPLVTLGSIVWDGLLFGIKELIVPLASFTTESVLPEVIEALGTALDILNTALDFGVDLYKDFVKNFLKPIASFTKPYLMEFLQNFNKEFKEFADRLEQSSIWDDFRTILNEIYELLVPLVEKIVEFIEPIANFVVSVAFDLLLLALQSIEDILGLIVDLINGDFSSAWEHLENLFINNPVETAKDVFEEAKEAVDGLAEAVDGFAESADEALEGFVTAWGDNIDRIIETWKTDISTWWEQDVKPWFTKEKWGEIFSSIGEALGYAFVGTLGFFEQWDTNIEDAWENHIKPWFTVEKWKELYSNISTALNDFFVSEDGFIQTWERNITDWWYGRFLPWYEQNIVPWFGKEKWIELALQIKDGFIEGLKDIPNGFIAIFNDCIDNVQEFLNTVIFAINKFIEGFNRVSSVVPWFSPVKKLDKVDLSKYKIPMLAQGTVVPPNKRFMAMLGDNTKEHEIVSPISTMKQAFTEAMSEMGSMGQPTREEHYYLDETELMRIVYKLFKGGERLSGTSLVEGGAY